VTVSAASADDHKQLRDELHRFFAAHAGLAAVREAPGHYDPAAWRRMATQLGLQGLCIPECFGGAGQGLAELGIVLDEMGYALAVSPYVATVVLAAQVIAAIGDEAARQRWLPGIAAGELTATLALIEDGGTWGLDVVDTIAEQAGGQWSVTGAKLFVLDGCTADLLLTVARTSAGLGVFAVSRGARGVSSRRMDTLDITRPLARLEFEAAPAVRADGPGDATGRLRAVLDLIAIALAAEQLGGARRCLDMAVGHAMTRVQFGRPIGSFQAIKHMCADVLVRLESARSAYLYAVGLEAGAGDRTAMAATVTRAMCSAAFSHAAKQNIQIHGGIGYTWEHDAHLFLRRAKSVELLFGSPSELLSRHADLAGI
jgi:alkylation response protein AidB-like acyl-CoA dehydrogenase